MSTEHVQRNQPETIARPVRKVWGQCSAWIDRHPAVVLSSILLLALILGIIKLRIDPPSPEFNWENRWWQIAINLTRGDGYVSCKPNYFPFCGPGNAITAMREPLPVLAFALIALLTNESLFAAASFVVLINLAIVVAVFQLTREVSNTRTGLLAALLWTCYLAPVRLFYSQISGDLFACLGITWGLMYFLRALKSGRSTEWFLSGALFGLAILSRSAILVVAAALTIALLFWLIAHSQDSLSARVQRLIPVFIFASAWILVISPWVIRNTMVFGRPVIGSTLSGYYLYRQNHILPTDDYLRFVSGGEFEPVIVQMIARRPELTGSENEAQMNEIYLQEGVQVIREYPLRYLVLSAYRFAMLWFNWGVNEVYGKPNALGDIIMVVQHVFLLVGGMIGLRGRFQQLWPLVFAVLSFSGVYVAVMAHLPYIVPITPGLFVLTAIALMQIVPWRTRSLNQAAEILHES